MFILTQSETSADVIFFPCLRGWPATNHALTFSFHWTRWLESQETYWKAGNITSIDFFSFQTHFLTADIGTAPLTTQKRQSVNKYSVRDIPIVLSVNEKTQMVHCTQWHVKKIHQRNPFKVSLLRGTDHIRSWPMGVPLTLGKVFDPRQQPSGRVLASVSTPRTP